MKAYFSLKSALLYLINGHVKGQTAERDRERKIRVKKGHGIRNHNLLIMSHAVYHFAATAAQVLTKSYS